MTRRRMKMTTNKRLNPSLSPYLFGIKKVLYRSSFLARWLVGIIVGFLREKKQMSDDGLCDLDQLDQMINDLGSSRRVRTPPRKHKNTTTNTRLDDFDDLLVLETKKEESQKDQKCYPNAYAMPGGECGATRHNRVKWVCLVASFVCHESVSVFQTMLAVSKFLLYLICIMNLIYKY